MKYSPFYRILVVLFCFLFLGLFVFLPFVNEPNINWTLFYIVLGVYLALLVAVIVWMEVAWAKKYKKEDEEEAKKTAERLLDAGDEDGAKEQASETDEVNHD